jgi:hypothetical protein
MNPPATHRHRRRRGGLAARCPSENVRDISSTDVPRAHAEASSTIPAATVSFVASSITMNAPVARLRA